MYEYIYECIRVFDFHIRPTTYLREGTRSANDYSGLAGHPLERRGIIQISSDYVYCLNIKKEDELDKLSGNG